MGGPASSMSVSCSLRASSAYTRETIEERLAELPQVCREREFLEALLAREFPRTPKQRPAPQE